MLIALGTAAEQTLGPLIAEQQLGGARAWGLLSAMLALGGMFGGLLALRLPISRRPLLIATLAISLTALPLTGLAVPIALPVLSVCFVLAGFGVAVFDVLWLRTLQAHIPAQSLSRVSAFDVLGSIALSPVGYALMGPLVDWIGIRGSLIVAICGVLVPSALVLLIPDVRQLPIRPVADPRVACVARKDAGLRRPASSHGRRVTPAAAPGRDVSDIFPGSGASQHPLPREVRRRRIRRITRLDVVL